jgi:NAD(P)-dependent dehydrogenase (short-subunit alcohol dehydrogenase family)
MPSGMPLSIVTGANKGIGLAVTAELKRRGHSVIATCRTSSPALEKVGVEIVRDVDVATDRGVAALVAAVGARSVDWLVNNAGIYVQGDRLGELNLDGIRKQFEVNALAPLRVTDALRDRLGNGAKVALVTSRMGSIDDNTSGGAYGYRMSKAALNMAGKSLAVDLKPRGVAVAILHPGMVKTDMIGRHGQVEPEDAARDLVTRIEELTLETSGTFWHIKGQKLPW